ncbi:MAG: hypothetical protein MUD12_15180 [Spirochaetes bacterium]|jgi:hypothetical protein|nr:hypothetical protein [Spirochaetota bacterium]
MKKALTSVLLIGMSLFSCYDSNGDFTRVMLLIQTPPTANISTLHVGAYLGAVSPSTLISKSSFPTSSIITMIIPNNQIIVFGVFAEELLNGTTWPSPTFPPYPAITYYGYSIPVIMQGQPFGAVSLDMNPITVNPPFVTYNTDTFLCTWSPLPLSDYYELQEDMSGDYDWGIKYFTTSTSYNIGHIVSSVRLRGCSASINACTDWLSIF